MHRLQVSRKEIMHFVVCFEEYIMQSVLDSCQRDLDKALKKAKSINHVAELHTNHLSKIIERSLLHKKAAPVVEVIRAIFTCCLTYKTIANQDIASIKANYYDFTDI